MFKVLIKMSQIEIIFLEMVKVIHSYVPFITPTLTLIHDLVGRLLELLSSHTTSPRFLKMVF